MHSTLPPVALLRVGKLSGLGSRRGSSAKLSGQDVRPDPQSSSAYSAPSKLAAMRIRFDGSIMLMNQISGCCDV